MTQEPTTGRRGFLRLLGGTVAAASFGQAFGQTTSPALHGSSLLNLATTAEALAVTFYHHALNHTEFGIEADTRRHLLAILTAEGQHLTLLRSLGGQPVTDAFALPADLHANAGTFVHTGLHLESTFLQAYLVATQQFAAAGQPELAATAAQLGASEAQHLTVLSQVAGYGPGDLTWSRSPLTPEQAQLALAPFLQAAPAGDSITLTLPRPAGPQRPGLIPYRPARQETRVPPGLALARKRYAAEPQAGRGDDIPAAWPESRIAQ
ncbi:hypothetical protein D3875_01620 [Deinococcus cavernae]|uniref:Ferritin-like domain-containing protein n=1 Tax=Deinococcus cavernae TaxID=2320857 RepID=A0A418VGI0_9DEIO|nr:ferritin-like domain-containing protein [Deinococcus cavernae]RJF75235.1 hypothetical protein D3875_01620 [Deinococcus cavernae]